MCARECLCIFATENITVVQKQPFVAKSRCVFSKASCILFHFFFWSPSCHGNLGNFRPKDSLFCPAEHPSHRHTHTHTHWLADEAYTLTFSLGGSANAVNFSQRAQKTLKTNLWICKPTPALIYVHLGKENWEPMLGKNKY